MTRLAFLFPGQGSWSADALAAWRGHDAASAAAERVGRLTAIDPWDLPGHAGERTELAQPALLAASLAGLAALEEEDVTAAVVAGHSLGEITAAVAAGAVDADDASRLVAERGAAFAAACRTTPGGMAAVVRLTTDEVETIVAGLEDVTIANLNAPGQIVVSGTHDALAEIRDPVRSAGGRTLPLPVEGAFHSPAMAPAAARMATAVRRCELHDPELPLVSGTTGEVLTDADAVAGALIDGVLAPVRWIDVQRRLAALEVDRLVEIGPGAVLAGLARRTVGELPVSSVAGPDDVAALLQELEGVPEPAGAAR